jgi:hypothetical protein
MGLDATVAYPSITYRFRNSLDVPIVLREKVAGGIVRAEILGPERKLTVSYFRRIDEVLPFEEAVRETKKLPEGERVVTQRGIPGFRATSSRVVRDGAYAERTKWSERYPPTTQIVSVGIGEEGTKARVQPDTHAEYTVDEVLVMTQGPAIRTPGAVEAERGGGMIEQRTPGKTGEAGWIEKLGLAKTPVAPEGEGEGGTDEKGEEKNEKGEEKKEKGEEKKEKGEEKKEKGEEKKERNDGNKKDKPAKKKKKPKPEPEG